MTLYSFSDIEDDFGNVFNTALSDDVIIAGNDGMRFKLTALNSIEAKKLSPLEHIKGIQTNITMDDILDAIHGVHAR
jgi:hypothetical protein